MSSQTDYDADLPPGAGRDFKVTWAELQYFRDCEILLRQIVELLVDDARGYTTGIWHIPAGGGRKWTELIVEARGLFDLPPARPPRRPA